MNVKLASVDKLTTLGGYYAGMTKDDCNQQIAPGVIITPYKPVFGKGFKDVDCGVKTKDGQLIGANDDTLSEAEIMQDRAREAQAAIRKYTVLKHLCVEGSEADKLYTSQIDTARKVLDEALEYEKNNNLDFGLKNKNPILKNIGRAIKSVIS